MIKHQIPGRGPFAPWVRRACSRANRTLRATLLPKGQNSSRPIGIAVFTLACLALAGCDSLPGLDQAKPQPVAAMPPPPDPQTQMAPLEIRIATLIEEQREKIDPKAKKLAFDPELQRIARERARDMASKNYLAHAAPNGDTSASLLMAEDGKFQGLLGENLAAQHYRKESGVDVVQFAQRFLETWVNSPPHRDNFSYPNYDRTGVGAAVNGDTVYVAQLFATDMGLPPVKDGTPPAAVTPYDSPGAAQSDSANGQPPAPIRLRGAE
jgi:uncharacterized protein YkwD